MARGASWAVALLLGACGSGAVAAEELPELFRRVDPGVVEIFTTAAGGGGSRGLGSGFLVSADGLVITAAHVVQTADTIVVRFLSGEAVQAFAVASDPEADVALIRVGTVPQGTPILPLGDSDRIAVGERIFVVGAPMGMSHTLSVGYVSARRPSPALYGGLTPVELLQTDAVINRGNSGGPMFNLDGEVVGVVSHILSSAGGAEGLGFVASSNLARRVLLEEPTMWSGMSGFLLDGELAGVFNLPQGAGILVQRVAAGSPAERLGLRAGTLSGRVGEHELLLGGDVILAVQGIRLDEPAAVHRIRAAIAPGSDATIEVEVLRAGGVLRLTTTHPATSRENR